MKHAFHSLHPPLSLPSPQVGACIVDRQNVICGIGYNGFPRGCPDAQLPWSKAAESGDLLDTKYPYVCHAEMNALLNKNGASVSGAVRGGRAPGVVVIMGASV